MKEVDGSIRVKFCYPGTGLFTMWEVVEKGGRCMCGGESACRGWGRSGEVGERCVNPGVPALFLLGTGTLSPLGWLCNSSKPFGQNPLKADSIGLHGLT